ncbi:hypothetical protein PoB_005748200 [Plakobranchus ocellatus]|uniref:Uncharacterized protein n=1 Tax=Plakobranchus ocellatus TaxID=259542 RepID=A0AAV4CI38_9GAST|nr:hypothetical protein PoB_005748200 [Plakobranchus ocellatus]
MNKRTLTAQSTHKRITAPRTMCAQKNFEGKENDERARELRWHRERSTQKRTSKATMHAQENFDGSENDARTRELRRLRERCVHKRTSTVPRTMHVQ